MVSLSSSLDCAAVEVLQASQPKKFARRTKAKHSSQSVPRDWLNAVIVSISLKGNLSLCDNWQGIS